MKQQFKKILTGGLSVLTAAAVLFPTAELLRLEPSAASFVTGANSASSAYRSSIYYQNLMRVPLTGNGRTDVLAVALSQLGYMEGNSKGQYAGTLPGSGNYTEYNRNMGDFGAGYGGAAYEWCASFVSFCLLQAGCHHQTDMDDWCRNHRGDPDYIWREVSCAYWASQLRRCGYFQSSASYGGRYAPMAGDLIFFTEDGKTESHIGLVLYSDGKRVYTVEGNTYDRSGLSSNGGGVYVKSYPVTANYIRGYGVLPYAVNSHIQQIDYSGKRPTEGLYISNCRKYLYASPTSDSHRILPPYSLFEVVEISESGRLKVICRLNGTETEGYLENNSDRIIQLSAKEGAEGFNAVQDSWGYLGSRTEGWKKEGGGAVPELLGSRDRLEISGALGMNRKIRRIGYYFDGLTEKIIWTDGGISENSRFGRYGINFVCQADAADFPEGSHRISLVTELADSTVLCIASVEYRLRQSPGAVPSAPKVEQFRDGQILLSHAEGFEYRMEGGEWQKSPRFDGLEEGTVYIFYRRLCETETEEAGVSSEGLKLTLRELKEAEKLTELRVGGYELSPEFHPETADYRVTVSNSTQMLEIFASAPERTDIEVKQPPLEAGKETVLTVVTHSPYGGTREYRIAVYRETQGETVQIRTAAKDWELLWLSLMGGTVALAVGTDLGKQHGKQSADGER